MEKFASPCISICKMSAKTGFCEGCFRTRDEISRWQTADYQEQINIVSELQERRKYCIGIVRGRSST